MKAALPPANSPFFNTATGLINPEWYLALRAILQRTGGTAEDLVEQSLRVDTVGFVVATQESPGAAVTRVLTAGPGITIANGDGLAGNPVFTALGPDGFGFFVGGLMADAELLGSGVLDRDILFPSTFNPPVVVSEFPATANAVLNIKALIAGVETQVGTITVLAGSMTGTVAWTPSPYTLPSGTPLRLYAPSPRDVTLSMITGLVPGDLT